MAWPKRRPRHRRGPGSPVIIIGISYEGIDPHDIITESGIAFEAPEDIRTDGVEFRGTTLPDMNEPRKPSRF
jgi:hypothetical protein